MNIYKGADLAAFAKKAKADGVKFLLGGNFEILTPERLEILRVNNPGSITASRYAFAKDNYIGQRVTDCSGLIYGFLKDGKRRTSAALYNNAAKRIKITSQNADKIPAGAVLWREGHVGVSIGGGNEIDARGFDYGIQERKIKNTGFTHYLLFSDFDYNKTGGGFLLPALLIGAAALYFITKK